MAELRVADFDDELMARIKAAAALSRSSIKDFLHALIADALRRREGRKRQ